MKKEKDELLEDGKDLCEKCGNELVEEGGIKVCPKCDGAIDFFGENNE